MLTETSAEQWSRQAQLHLSTQKPRSDGILGGKLAQGEFRSPVKEVRKVAQKVQNSKRKVGGKPVTLLTVPSPRLVQLGTERALLSSRREESRVSGQLPQPGRAVPPGPL